MNCHKNYKVSHKEALNKTRDDRQIRKVVSGAIRHYVKDHGETINEGSLTKRICGTLHEYHARLYLDRVFINYLCTNRIDLTRVEGELRNALLKIIEKELSEH